MPANEPVSSPDQYRSPVGATVSASEYGETVTVKKVRQYKAVKLFSLGIDGSFNQDDFGLGFNFIHVINGNPKWAFGQFLQLRPHRKKVLVKYGYTYSPLYLDNPHRIAMGLDFNILSKKR